MYLKKKQKCTLRKNKNVLKEMYLKKKQKCT